MRAKILLSTLVVSLLVLSGCKNQTPEEEVKQAVEKYVNAFTDYNKDELLSVISGSERTIRYVSEVYDFYTAIKQFKEAVITEYGQEGWEVFEDQVTPETITEEIDPNSITIEIQGDKAICSTPDQKGLLTLIKQDNKWYIDTEEMAKDSSEEEINYIVDMLSGMTMAVENVKQRIGQMGVKPEHLRNEYQQRLMWASRDAMPVNRSIIWF